MTRHLHRKAAAAALAAALLTSGCADLPVVGPVFQSISPMLEPILSPIKSMMGMDEPPPPVVKPTPRPNSRAARAKAEAQANAAASGSVAANQTENSEAQFARMSERNKEFDRLRTTGLMQLYGGETRMAIETFEKAAKIRPGDAHIRELIELAKNPPRIEAGEGIPSGPGGFLQ